MSADRMRTPTELEVAAAVRGMLESLDYFAADPHSTEATIERRELMSHMIAEALPVRVTRAVRGMLESLVRR